MARRDLQVNWVSLLNFISQYPQIIGCAVSPTIKDWDIFIVNKSIWFPGYEITL
jgi:hypothetical protein